MRPIVVEHVHKKAGRKQLKIITTTWGDGDHQSYTSFVVSVNGINKSSSTSLDRALRYYSDA